MKDRSILLINGNEINQIVSSSNINFLDIVRDCYSLHEKGDSSIPFSSFLRFPHKPSSRIIGLPAYLGGRYQVAGMKWISSFPENISRNTERASATLLLNSMGNGRVISILESSLISAIRTAASAVLAVKELDNEDSVEHIGIVGCGMISFRTVQMIAANCACLKNLYLFDIDEHRCNLFQSKVTSAFPGLTVSIASSTDKIFTASEVVVLATTASEPHIYSFPDSMRTRLILHLSLRDITPELILKSVNIVDDVEHVCRERTSIHLASMECDSSKFINATIGQIINKVRRLDLTGQVTIYSPFGLGVLDIGIGYEIYDYASRHCIGTKIGNYFPANWLR